MLPSFIVIVPWFVILPTDKVPPEESVNFALTSIAMDFNSAEAVDSSGVGVTSGITTAESSEGIPKSQLPLLSHSELVLPVQIVVGEETVTPESKTIVTPAKGVPL